MVAKHLFTPLYFIVFKHNLSFARLLSDLFLKMLKILLKIFLTTEYNTERFKEEGEGTTRVFRGNFREFTAHLYLYCAVLSHLSHVLFFATLWIIACQAPLSMGFSRQEYWGRLQPLPLGNLPNPGIKPTSLVSSASTGRVFTTSAT